MCADISSKKNVLAVIPARGGSKGIPKKNLREINGISLVGRAIQVAASVQKIDDIFVSTDTEEIANEAERFEKLGVKFVKRPDDGKMKGLAFIQDPDGYWIEILQADMIEKNSN